MEAQKKSDGISGKDGKDTTQLGNSQACRWGIHNIFQYFMTIGKKSSIKWLGVIRRGSYQAEAEDRRWEYVPVSDFWPDIDPASNSSVDGWSEVGRKDQEGLDDQ